jgi:hypothetical protein
VLYDCNRRLDRSRNAGEQSTDLACHVGWPDNRNVRRADKARAAPDVTFAKQGLNQHILAARARRAKSETSFVPENELSREDRRRHGARRQRRAHYFGRTTSAVA